MYRFAAEMYKNAGNTNDADEMYKNADEMNKNATECIKNEIY
jgi:hypothetical protein